MRPITSRVVRIMGPTVTEEGDEPSEIDKRNQAVIDDLSWDFIEETISDLVPEGYYCKIDD